MNPERELALTLANNYAKGSVMEVPPEEVVARAEKYLAFLSKPPLPGYPVQPLQGMAPMGIPATPGHDPKRWPR